MIEARRVESPSSINTYNQCPRKYYYHYIARLPTKGNIHTIKGNTVHSVLESFFDYKFEEDTTYENAEIRFKSILFNLFSKFWKSKAENLGKIEVSERDIAIGVDDCVNMIYLWAEVFLKRMKKTKLPFKEALKFLTPLHKEKYFISKQHFVQGFIDVIEKDNEKIRLMDYKTSNSAYLTDEYLLQLGIYALLYKETFNSIPQEVGVYFLKEEEGEKVIKVNEDLLENASKQIIKHHSKTKSNNIDDYPKHISHLCKWATGQCDFYDKCFKPRINITINKFDTFKQIKNEGLVKKNG